jgi:capsular polysaccharide biosynthesis protein
MESGNFNFSSLVDLILRHIKVYVVVVLIAIGAAVVVTMPAVMTPKYNSIAVVYPLNLKPYSDESQTEQLLQYFEASSVRDSLIARFDLYERYDIDPQQEGARHYLLQEFSDRFVVSKTLYESVRVEVTDEDPTMARDMCDAYLRLVNQKINRSINSQGLHMASSYKLQMDYQRTVIDTIEAEIARLSAGKRVLDYGSQTRELVRGYIELSSRGGNSAALREVSEWLESTQESGSLLRMLQNLSYFATMQYETLTKEYFRWREMADRDILYLDVVVEPEVSDKKAWPVRWLILVIMVVSAVVLLTVVLAVNEALRKA